MRPGACKCFVWHTFAFHSYILSKPLNYIADLAFIAARAAKKEEENDHFLHSLRSYDSTELDTIVHGINQQVSDAIDCTECGNCCNKLVINVTHEEMVSRAERFNMSNEAFKEKYLEESQQGALFINTIPCHFFAEKKCTIYNDRFQECRDFPHLHKPGFKARFLGTLMHYGNCPIVYNVVEELKERLGFVD